MIKTVFREGSRSSLGPGRFDGGSKVHLSPEQSLALDHVRQPLLSECRPSWRVDKAVGLDYEDHLHGQSVRHDFRHGHDEVDAHCPLDRPLRARGAEAGPVVAEDGMFLLFGGAEKV